MEEAPAVRARSGLIALVVLIAGCDRLFGIEEQLPDAPRPADAFDPNADSDADGFPDATDNCPNVPNPDQSDVDGDGFGDECDRCPLDVDDQSDQDGDNIGNACDPNPSPYDCLILLDTFGDPVTFATHWFVTVDSGDMVRVTFNPTKPTITTGTGKYQGIYAVDQGVPLHGPHDVQVLGMAMLGPDSAVFATTHEGVTSPKLGGMCGFRRAPGAGGIVSGVNESHDTAGVSTMPFFDFGTNVSAPVRMSLFTDHLPSVSCTVSTRSVASSGTVGMWDHAPAATGNSGVTVYNTSFEIDAVALYQQRGSSEACPATIRR